MLAACETSPPGRARAALQALSMDAVTKANYFVYSHTKYMFDLIRHTLRFGAICCVSSRRATTAVHFRDLCLDIDTPSLRM
eukprot:222575-Chlamydomonas_euryale.AAC.3